MVGLLQSCAQALGPVVRLMTRSLYSFIVENVEKFSWSFFTPLSDEARTELLFWMEQLRNLNGFHFSPSLSLENVDFELCSDASAIGVFGYQFKSNYEVILRRLFTASERRESSTFRELVALHDIYLSEQAERYRGKNVRHITDNQAVVQIMKIGSRNKRLHEMVLRIFLRCRELGISLEVVWRSREDPLVALADEGSRKFDQSSYSLDFNSFSAMMDFFSHVVEWGM